MRFVPEPLRIGRTEGFKSDLFGFRTFGVRLANIVTTLKEPSVLALDGAEGSGKSVFVRQWAGLLRSTDVRVVRFDAHKHDHDQDAFFAIASEVCAQAPVHDDEKKPLLESVVAVADSIGPVVENLAWPLFLGGALKLRDLRMPVDGDASSLWERRIESVRKDKNTVRCLRRRLSALATGGAPLVVIIDELDRCRPTFALSVLDRAKHLFDAERLCFVLVGDYSQIRRLVAKEYGMCEDEAIRYLNKYISLSFRLPATCAARSDGEADATGVRYLRYLWDKTGLSQSTVIPDLDHDLTLMSGLHALIDAHQMSLRSVERVVSNLVLFCSAVCHAFPVELVIGLSIMRVLDPALYDCARSGRLTDEAVESFLRLSEWKNGDFATRYRKRWTRALAQRSETVGEGPTELIPGRDGPLVIHGGGDLVATICRYMEQVAQDDRH